MDGLHVCWHDDGDEQLVASALHFVENLLVVGGFAVSTNKQSGLLHVVRQETGRLLRPIAARRSWGLGWMLVLKSFVALLKPVH